MNEVQFIQEIFRKNSFLFDGFHLDSTVYPEIGC